MAEEETEQKVDVRIEREVKTYMHMRKTSKFLLEEGKDKPRDSYFMSSLIFTAFTLESYLNHIGKKAFSCWNDLERLPHKRKINIISDRLGFRVNYGVPPWKVIKDLFVFRNYIAHGETENLGDEYDSSLDEYEAKMLEFFRTEWEKYCTEDNAVKAIDEIENIINIIHKAAYEADIVKNNNPFIVDIQSRSATLRGK